VDKKSEDGESSDVYIIICFISAILLSRLNIIQL